MLNSSSPDRFEAAGETPAAGIARALADLGEGFSLERSHHHQPTIVVLAAALTVSDAPRIAAVPAPA
jgi:hypothetical protein